MAASGARTVGWAVGCALVLALLLRLSALPSPGTVLEAGGTPTTATLADGTRVLVARSELRPSVLRHPLDERRQPLEVQWCGPENTLVFPTTGWVYDARGRFVAQLLDPLSEPQRGVRTAPAALQALSVDALAGGDVIRVMHPEVHAPRLPAAAAQHELREVCR